MNHPSLDCQVNLAIIPARGGSKRLPGKNIRTLCGRPSIVYTIEAALESRLFREVVVSTDDETIASVSRAHGASVPFIRQTHLADDYTPVSLATLDALEKLDPDGTVFQSVAQLMANCPLRTAKDVRASYRQFVETGADSQISVARYDWLNPWWAMTRDGRFRLTFIFDEQRVTGRSQDLPEVFCPTGAIWWAKADVLRREKTFHIADRTGWVISWQRAVDIDTEDDWQLAELVMQTRQQRSRG